MSKNLKINEIYFSPRPLGGEGPGVRGWLPLRVLAEVLSIVLTVPLLVAGPAKVSAQSPAQTASAADDALLRAMQSELDRSKSQIKMQGADAPYFLEYRVADVQEYEAHAAFGALVRENRLHLRFARVVVRVGDYKDDSYFGQGQGVADYMGLDDDELALKHQLWLLTDRAYKDAIEALAAKRAGLQRFKIEQPVDDFSRAPAVQSVGPLAELSADPPTWRQALIDSTALYRRDPEIEALESSAVFSATNHYYVNSEGTVTRQGSSLYRLGISTVTQAADGMYLARSPAYAATRLEDLPTPAQFIARAADTLASLQQLRAAPIVEEEYRGPVLFVPDAANDVISTFVGRNVLGNRPPPGGTARTTGEYASNFKSRVLPVFLSVIDDPTQATFNGHGLIGSYAIDDEGVKAQPVKLIEQGVLVNYLLGREPLRDLPGSNGHGRAGPAAPPFPSLGNLFLTSSQPVSPAELKQKILALCRQQSKPYGYLVKTLGGPANPLLLYRVWANDGREELVRGAVFHELDPRALRNDLIAVGNDPEVSNNATGVPFSVISPSLLFDELEVKRNETGKEKLPEYPPPPVNP